MIKLYRKQDGRITHYHEAWLDVSGVTEHWGPLGERGQTTEHPRKADLSEYDNLQSVLAIATASGFLPIETEDHAVLAIEYAVNGMGSTNDLDKRNALISRMDETLGWTGLGHCDGGSIGSGTMEVCCLVVDFDIAKRVIEADLRKTTFADYTRIYREDID
jgi:hypothetical protein